MNLDILNSLTLLYVEDDKEIQKRYSQSLKLLFKKIYVAINYNEAIKIYKQNSPDIILVDINLDGLSGIDIVKSIRKNDIKTPIVFLTAHSDNKYLLEAANLQIDGYIIKPLDIDKLYSVMVNCLKKIENSSIISIDNEIFYDLNTQELFKNDQKISLGKKENKLLKFFLNNKNSVLSRDEIEYEIWEDKVVTDSSIKNLIGTLRKKIGKDKIVNILGIGWKINLS